MDAAFTKVYTGAHSCAFCSPCTDFMSLQWKQECHNNFICDISVEYFMFLCVLQNTVLLYNTIYVNVGMSVSYK